MKRQAIDGMAKMGLEAIYQRPIPRLIEALRNRLLKLSDDNDNAPD